MGKKILLLGSTGKMGIAINEVFSQDYSLIGKNSTDFDALDFRQVSDLINKENPDIVINTVALLGIDPCEKDPERAFRMNTIYPKLLAELSSQRGFLLIHFSTDAVFNDDKRDFYNEQDQANPLNMYGFTKFGGDCFIQSIAKRYYIFRISVLFGKAIKNNQFMEKMLERIKAGQKVLRVSDDIILSPTYSKDVALEVKRILERSDDFGLYHITNEGKASLFELMLELAKELQLDVRIEKASFKDFPYVGRKNTCTPLTSTRIKPLRPWKEALHDYCDSIKLNYKKV